MRGHCQPCVLNPNASWKLCSLEEDEETDSAHFPHFGVPLRLGGRIPLFPHSPPPVPPVPPRFPLLSPLLVSCIITGRFKDGPDEGGESNAGESEGHGWIRWGGGVGWGRMFVSITPWFQQGDRLEKYFLGCQRKGPLTGGLRHHKSSVILSMPLFSPLALSYFYASNSLCTGNTIRFRISATRVPLNSDPHTLFHRRNFDTIPVLLASNPLETLGACPAALDFIR